MKRILAVAAGLALMGGAGRAAAQNAFNFGVQLTALPSSSPTTLSVYPASGDNPALTLELPPTGRGLFYRASLIVGGHLAPMVSVGFSRSSATVERTAPDQKQTLTARVWTVTPTVGGRFFFRRPERSKTSPYAVVLLSKTFASVSGSSTINTASTALDGGVVNRLEDEAGPIGLSAGFGFEHFLTGEFSFGGEAGWQSSRTSAVAVEAADTETRLTRSDIAPYGSLVLNFYF